ncbi:MAG TPA: deoxyguanosinetriphosphate triphosphohydrolase [Chthoniobacteraceae bacterium]|jgi:dGTPase|nr:deoxyguanosinetriphosphate triphosphohydrolase [Chthoniobacteraceae bacterium]
MSRAEPQIRGREALEAQEGASLAPYAQKSGESAGRAHPEPRHPYRTEYQRDRARIIHSRAFRRLEQKTQVFLTGTSDHLRTRLTHTIEVASISRSIARALALNEDLAEAIALAHDLGHAPFGHSGESELNRLMRGHEGFNHNRQSLRVVELIETKYPEFPGLNLSFEVLEGLHKHAAPPLANRRRRGAPHYQPSLEAQIANLADEITYYSHDLDDGLDSGLIEPAQLAPLEVWRHSFDEVRRDFPRLAGPELGGYVIRCIIDRQVQDVISWSAAAIAASRVRSAEEVRRRRRPLIGYSRELRAANRALRKFLYANLYYNPAVAIANRRGCRMLRAVFNAYVSNPSLLGRSAVRRIRREGLERSVCDYLSGMTDGYLLDEHARLFGGELASERSPCLDLEIAD